METTTLRVRTTTQVRLKKISAEEHLSITDLVDRLVNKYERRFWMGFDEEAEQCLDKREIKARKVFDGASGDGIDG